MLKQGVQVVVVRDGKGYPAEMRPLLTPADARELNCSFIGLAVPPVFRKPHSADEFPLLARSLRHSLSLALRQTISNSPARIRHIVRHTITRWAERPS